MRIRNYFYKLSLFSITEKVSILIFSTTTYVFENLNKNLVKTYLFYADFIKEGVKITNEGESNIFQYNINGQDFNFLLKRNSSDALVFKQLILETEYQDIIKLLQTHNIKLEKMIDGGANIGLAAIYFKAHFPDTEIIALEPVSTTFQRLQRNIFEKNKLDSIICIKKGLWSKNTFLKIDKSNRDKSDWAFRLVESNVAGENTIEATDIDSILAENNWGHIDFLKLDIEGGESEVFKDYETVSNWLPKVKILAIEIHDEFDCRERIYKLLEAFGFEYFESSSLTVGINKSL